MIDKEPMQDVRATLDDYLRQIDATGYECYEESGDEALPVCRCSIGGLFEGCTNGCNPVDHHCLPYVKASLDKVDKVEGRK